MKYILILLFSFIAVFTISSKSWAGEIDGKGLICEKFNGKKNSNYPNINTFYFDQEKAYVVEFFNSSTDPIKKIKVDKSYHISAKEIHFKCTKYSSDFCGLNRQTLILTAETDSEVSQFEVQAKYQCKVTDWSGILEHYKPALEKHKEEMKKNKI